MLCDVTSHPTIIPLLQSPNIPLLLCIDLSDGIFYIYGHSYELTQKERNKSFSGFEEVIKKLAYREDILYLTNIEARQAVII